MVRAIRCTPPPPLSEIHAGGSRQSLPKDDHCQLSCSCFAQVCTDILTIDKEAIDRDKLSANRSTLFASFASCATKSDQWVVPPFILSIPASGWVSRNRPPQRLDVYFSSAVVSKDFGRVRIQRGQRP
jgi:hypothetical protein